MTTTNIKKPNKYVALVTYLFAVICLLLGLFLPFWGEKGILVLQLPDLINKLANTQLISVKTEFALSYPVNIFCSGVHLDVMAVYALLYLGVVALSLIMLIPIIVCTVKKPAAASVLIRIVETAAVIIGCIYAIIAIQVLCDPFAIFFGKQLEFLNYGLLVALGGSLLALIIQNISIRKGWGVAKTLLLLLAAIALVALFNLSWLIPQLDELIIFSPALFGGSDGISFARELFDGGLVDTVMFVGGWDQIAVIFIATILSFLVIANLLIDVIGLSTKTKIVGSLFNLLRYMIELIVAIALGIAIFVRKDTIGIMLIVIAAVAFLQLLTSLICFIIDVTFVVKNRKAKEEISEKGEESAEEKKDEVADAEPVEQVDEQTVQTEEPEPVLMEQPVEEAELITPDNKETSEQTEEKKPEPEKEENFEPVQEEIPLPPQNDNDGWDEPASFDALQEPPHTVQPEVAPIPVRPSTPTRSNVYANEQEVRTTQIYTINTIYGGPVDDFMRKLTNEEKVEFAQTFIEKSRGNIGNIPDYVIGGNNRTFFSSVFIYLGRIRGLISDGLLNKMYKELNLL